MRISDWSSDVCSSDLPAVCVRQIEILPSIRNLQDDPETVVSPDHRRYRSPRLNGYSLRIGMGSEDSRVGWFCDRLVTRARGRRGWPSRQVAAVGSVRPARSEEPTSELQSLMRISYSCVC